MIATEGFDHRFAGGSTIAPTILLATPNEPSKSSPSLSQALDSATGFRTQGIWNPLRWRLVSFASRARDFRIGAQALTTSASGVIEIRGMKPQHTAPLACEVLVIFFLAAPSVLPIETLSLPAGWRLLRPDEIAQSWRLHSPSRYLSATGDFVGDGNTDTAIILVRDDGSGFAPFVALTGSDHKRRFLQGGETNPLSYLHDEGIKLLKSGKYVTTCGKGYGCSKGEKESVIISTDAVEFFKNQGPARMIYWDKTKGALSEVWLSD